MAGVWVATLERFGYTLLVVERTKQKALDAMSDEYTKTYYNVAKNFNGETDNSWEKMAKNNAGFKSDYETAMEEVYCRKLEYGAVEWC